MINKAIDIFISLFLLWLCLCLLVGLIFYSKSDEESSHTGGSAEVYIPEEQYEPQKMFNSVAPTLSPVDFSDMRQITSFYGLRYLEEDGYLTEHHGIDIAGLPGEQIRATGDGVVTDVWIYHKIFGKCIWIRHDNGYCTLYGHLDRTFVYEGQKVKAGQVIGIMGNTGKSYGRHLHYAVTHYGRWINPLLVMRDRPDDEGFY